MGRDCYAIGLESRRIAIDQINALLRRNGLEIRPAGLPDQPDWIKAITARVAPYTMTSPERIASLCHAVEYTIKYDIPGDGRIAVKP